MVCRKPWFDSLLDEIGDSFCHGIAGGSVFYMLKGMYNSPKSEPLLPLIRGSQAVRMNVPSLAGYLAVYGGLRSLIDSSMFYVRQKDDPWNSILVWGVASGFMDIRQGLGPASRSALLFGSLMALAEGIVIVQNKVGSNVQSPKPAFEELDKE